MQYCRVATQDKISVITLEVESLVKRNIHSVRQALLPALRSHRLTVLDLGRVRYFDLMGFAEILHWVTEGNASGEIGVCSQSPEVHALFELLRAPSVVPFYWSKEEVLDHFARGRSKCASGVAVPTFLTAKAGVVD
jgi:anti-anti-sigma regulatory factor